jgi:hypothetical protein
MLKILKQVQDELRKFIFSTLMVIHRRGGNLPDIGKKPPIIGNDL